MLTSSANGVAAYQGAVWFMDWLGVLWRSDGTLAGTRPTVAFGGGYNLRVASTWTDRLLIVDRRWGPTEPRQSRFWLSDGTPAGTRFLASVPGVAFVAGSIGMQRQTLICDARSMGQSTHDALWTLDRAGALRWLTNTPADFNGSVPLTVFAGGKLVCTHDDGVTGRELWVWDPGATATPMPTGCAANRRAELTCDDPHLGTTISIVGGSTPASAIVALWLGAPTLPMPRVGACSLAALPEVLVATFQPAAPDWVRTLPIPNQSPLLGAQTVLQAAWGPTPSGVDVSNGVLLTFGR